jgi:hypothetical protein
MSAVGAEEILEELVRRIARAVVAEMRGECAAADAADEWLDQHHTDLTVRQHCTAVRRRREEGKPGAAIKGRRYLLTRAALREEMVRDAKHKGPALALVARLEKNKRGRG